MKAKYRWKEPIALYTKSKSGYVIYAPVKEVNWLFCELGCRTLIPWTTRYAFSRYTSSCQSSPTLMHSKSLPLVHGYWRAEPLIQGWILSTVNVVEGGTGRYGCSSQAFHGFCIWDLLYWHCWKDIWLQKAVSIYLPAPLHQAKLVLQFLPRGQMSCQPGKERRGHNPGKRSY